MDFTYDDEQRALRSAVREMATRLAPETTGDVPVGPQTVDPKAWQTLAEMGLLGLPIAEDAGGMGAGAVEVAIAASELGSARSTLPYADALTANVILAGAGHELLEGAVDGSALVLTAFGEPGAAWDPDNPQATGRKDGDGYVLSGHKLGATDLTGVAAVVTTAHCPDEGCTCVFLVENPTVEGTSLRLDGPATRLGDLDLLHRGLNIGLVTLGAEALGAMESALSMTVDYLKTRKQFGVPLATFQTLTQRAADMYTSVELARSTVLFAAMEIAHDPTDRATTSRLKAFVGRTGRHVGQEAIQLHGGIGMTAEYAVGHYTSRLTAIEHTFGDTRYHLARLAAALGDHEMVDVVS